jgi:4-hydroxy-3-methylbut-2-en-1-yl diphosphate reductase
MNTIVEIDSGSGFCSGVKLAVRLAEEELSKSGKLFCLGEIVHNHNELERLKARGLRIINYDEFSQLHNVKVLIRAHGEPPWIYETAKKNNIEIIDATCPIVARLQSKISADYLNHKGKRETLIIYGKHDHPEVRALVGQTEGTAKVISSTSELDNIDLNVPVHLYSQTTMNQQSYNELVEKLKVKVQSSGNDPSLQIQVYNSICGHVSHRQARLESFARMHDIILFISSKESSNGKMLYSFCKSVNSQSYFITDVNDLKDVHFEKSLSVGICGATSTPQWLLIKVSTLVNERISMVE